VASWRGDCPVHTVPVPRPKKETGQSDRQPTIDAELFSVVLSYNFVTVFLRYCLCISYVCWCDLLLRVCSFSLPYSSFDCDHFVRLWETPIYGDSSQTGLWYKEENVAIKFDIRITWEGLIVILVRRRTPQHGGRHWSNHGIKIIVSLVPFTLQRFSSS
jgi:hypothetical protein